MTPVYPPTLVYSWDYTDTVFDLELLRGPRLAKGWKLEGGVKAVNVVVGNQTVLKQMQTYTRLEHRAVPRPKSSIATAESHAEIVAQRSSTSRPGFNASFAA